MKRTWSNEQIQFLKKNYPLHGTVFCAENLGKTTTAVKSKAKVLNLITGFRISETHGKFIARNIHLRNKEIADLLQIKEHRVRNYVNRHKLRKATWTYFSKEETEFVKKNYGTLSWAEIAEAIGRSTDSVRNKAKLLNLKRTKKQHRAICLRTSSHTWFEKGHQPVNTKSDGAISQRTDSNGNTYKYIRISMHNWAMLHVYNWEKINGPVPEGKILRSKNGNQLDCDPANWYPIDRATHLDLNNNGRKTLEDNYIVKLLSRRNAELEPLIAAQPELIQLKRNQLKLRRAINEHND